MKGYVVSPEFTIDDIHKIREMRYAETKKMTQTERIHYYNHLGEDVANELKRRKLQREKDNGGC